MNNQLQNVLIIGLVWPEPGSTGASVRMMEHIDLYLARGWDVTFLCPAASSEHAAPLQQLGVKTVSIQVNDSEFDRFIETLQPDMVLFDRFLMEEQFGWRVASHCPNAMRVIETIDLHCLREARQQALKQNGSLQLFNEVALREIAAIYRSDLSIIISDYEYDLLQKHFNIEPQLLHLCPFMLKRADEQLPDYAERQHFITIGNFRHAPNWDAVLQLKQEIWPKIRQKLPAAELHIYGAYTPPKATALHNQREGFIIKDRADDVHEVMMHSRVCLAPLRFGAGIKTKLADAMLAGTPSVTTPIGAEGMHNGLEWAGYIHDQAQAFADAAVTLYENSEQWEYAQQCGYKILDSWFDYETNSSKLLQRLKDLRQNLAHQRQQNFIGSMLNHHHHRSTEFMSRWIEEKNRAKS